MSNRNDALPEVEDPRIMELQARVRQATPHVPALGDADYQTPEQIARIVRERQEDES